MGLLDELEQLEKSKSKSEMVGLLKTIISNQQKILKRLDKISLAIEKQQVKKAKKIK
ncbi:MAG: hypothetical protein JSV49_02405 [Thermoplasmata archaeon]|nr:MAG: hypothetical protein JSV49_02405 [Thermoplasmata archaeon]